MSVFESFPLPGAPYLLAAVISCWSFLHSFELPDQPAEIAFVVAKSKAPRDLPETVALLCGEIVDDDDADDDDSQNHLMSKASW